MECQKSLITAKFDNVGEIVKKSWKMLGHCRKFELIFKNSAKNYRIWANWEILEKTFEKC